MDLLSEKILSQIPAMSVLVFLVLTFLKHMKAASEIQAKAVTEAATANAKEMDALRASLETVAQCNIQSQKVQARLAQILLYHDATVKGVNPDSMGTPKDIMDKILA